jgi:hypothetical protein
MRWTLFLAFLLPAFLTISPAKAKKEKKPEKPKQEKMATLYKNARNAVKNMSGQDAARNALLGALSRPELKNKQKAKIYYSAALLEQSLNGVENQKAFLKKPYDTAVFFNKLRDMYGQLRLCDSVDLAPDEKGVVHPRLQRKTHSLRNKHRRNILGGGKFYLAKKNYVEAYPFFDLYCSYAEAGKPDTILPQATQWATLSAFLSENPAGTIDHVDEAIKCSEPATAAILQEYKARSYAKLGNDSAFVASLKQGVQDYPDHDWFFVQLSDWYQGHRAFDEERSLADNLAKRTGAKAIHYYAKSKSYLSQGDYKACIALADSTILLDQNFADAYYNKGISYLNLAVISQEMSSKDTQDPQYLTDKLRTQELYKQAQPCMEKVRQLQPDRQDRWASPLYRIYLNLNLGDEFNEIDKLLNQK